MQTLQSDDIKWNAEYHISYQLEIFWINFSCFTQSTLHNLRSYDMIQRWWCQEWSVWHCLDAGCWLWQLGAAGILQTWAAAAGVPTCTPQLHLCAGWSCSCPMNSNATSMTYELRWYLKSWVPWFQMLPDDDPSSGFYNKYSEPCSQAGLEGQGGWAVNKGQPFSDYYLLDNHPEPLCFLPSNDTTGFSKPEKCVGDGVKWCMPWGKPGKFDW